MAFGPILNYRENFKNKDAKWCILVAFETIWKCRENFKKQGRQMVHACGI